MKLSKEDLLLYAVTDDMWAKDTTLVGQVKEALEGGVTILQYRSKSHQSVEEAKEIQALCKEYNVPFIINDNVELAKEIDADGVHLGQDDMSIKEAREILGDKIIGISTHNVDEAIQACKDGADYLGAGAVFVSSTKTDTTPLSFDELKKMCDSVDIGIVAIGGITNENIIELTGTHVSGAAVVSAIFGQENIKDACVVLKQKLNRIVHPTLHTAVTIAGSDSSGGAGVQADLKTMMANGVYAMSAITSLTAQNTVGVTDILDATPSFLANEIDAIFTDIYPEAIKIGMVSQSALINVIADKLIAYRARNIVVDTVMVATSGAKLISDEAIETLKERLLPLATVITPNIPEAEVLSEMKIHNEDEMVEAAKIIHDRYHCSVLLKGGHSINDANDLLYSDEVVKWYKGKRINNSNTHGTGCTLSSAIASNLAKGYSLDESVQRAKNYISNALAAMLDLGSGSGPMNHGFAIKGE